MVWCERTERRAVSEKSEVLLLRVLEPYERKLLALQKSTEHTTSTSTSTTLTPHSTLIAEAKKEKERE